jgi:hypothetical protein
MIAIDTLKLQIPSPYLNFNSDAFNRIRIEKNNALVTDRYDLLPDRMVHGLNGIRIDNTKNVTEISLSAKILGQDYLRGISLNTIEQAVDSINRSKVCDLSAVGEWIADSKVLYLDAVTNVDTGNAEMKSDILSCLATLTTGYKKDISPKKPITALVETVFYTKPVKDKKKRDAQRHYDKFAELVANHLFINSLPDKDKLMKSAVNLLRVESTDASFASIRKNYSIQDNTLSSVLHSHRQVNYERFIRIQQTGMQSEIAVLMDSVSNAVESGMKRLDYEKLMGRFAIIRMANFDIEVIRQYLIKFGDSNVRRTLKEYIRLIDDMNRDGMLSATTKSYKSILKRYTDMLAAA